MIFITGPAVQRETGVCPAAAGLYPGGAGAARCLGRAGAGRGCGDLAALAQQLARNEVVIATEVGGGVVPVDKNERAAREAAGRLGCLLAQRADAVVRVFCGIPVYLKGAPNT